MCPEENPWNPPSSNLLFSDGLWKPAVSRGEVSYPEKGIAFFEKVEHASFWFQHRNRCILEAVHRFFPGGYFYDIGGGNGFVAQTLENDGISTVVLEPGHGAHVARHRGLPRIIQSSLDEAGLREGSLDTAGCFDVISTYRRIGFSAVGFSACSSPEGSFSAPYRPAAGFGLRTMRLPAISGDTPGKALKAFCRRLVSRFVFLPIFFAGWLFRCFSCGPCRAGYI